MSTNDLVGKRIFVSRSFFPVAALFVALFLPPMSVQAADVFNGRLPTLVERTVDKYGTYIEVAALLHDEDVKLITSVIVVESEGNTGAVSHKGAQGLMQLMPATAVAMGARNPRDPMDNILAGTKYIKHLKDDYGFTMEEALVAYNMGPTRAKRWLSEYEPRDFIYTRKVMAVYSYLEKEEKEKLAREEGDDNATLLAIERAFRAIEMKARPMLTKPRSLSAATAPEGLRNDSSVDVVTE